MDFLTINEDFFYKSSCDEQDIFIRQKLKNQNTDYFTENPIKTDKKGKWIAEDFSTIPQNHCRKCKQEIKPYSEVFPRYFWDDLFKKYSLKNGYCKECAK